MTDQQHDSDVVLHQDAVEEVVDSRLDGVLAENEAIAYLTPITGGQSPTEAEHNTLMGAVNNIIEALMNSKVLPSNDQEGLT